MPRPAWNHGDKTAAERGYGRSHRALRARLLASEPLCRLCQQKKPPRTTPATIADHILPLAKGGQTTLENLQPVCAECHRAKTAKDKGHRWKREIALDGWPVE